MKIFVTGSTGFIGSHLVPKLLEQGFCVVCLVRPGSRNKLTCRNPNLQIIEGSLDGGYDAILSSIDYFLHLASYGVVHGCNDWETCFDINVSQYLRLLMSAISCGITKFLVVGSCFEYGKSSQSYERIPPSAVLLPTTAYAASKASASCLSYALAVQYNLKMIIVRPFHVYGEGEHSSRFWPSLVSAAVKGFDFPMTEGQQVRDFQNVTDTVRNIIDFIKFSCPTPGQPIITNLGSGNSQKLIEFARHHWHLLRARGSLMPGFLPYRDNEVMNYSPAVESTDFS